MSFKARMKVDGKEYTVLEAEYSLRQKTDPEGRPSSTTKGGIVRVVIEATDSTSFAESACNSYLAKAVTITYNKRDTESKMKEVTLATAYIVGYTEKFKANDETPMIEEIIFSAHELKIGTAVHVNDWPDI